MHKYEVLRRPLFSEKLDALGDLNQYAFEVAMRSNKQQVRAAVEGIFTVKVLKVRTMIIAGKSRRWGRRVVRGAAWKKAVVTLAPGDQIDLT